MKQKKEPIAVIGMAGRMPQANDLSSFWSNIQSGKDNITEIPQDRWDWRAYYGESGYNKSKAKWGGFLADVDKFDARFFGISPKEAEYIDPQHRLFLEAAWKTIEDSGYRPSDLGGKPISVFVGVSTQDYRKHLQYHDIGIDARISTGMAVSMLANRVSYLLNFSGPSDISDAACSSSLVAVHRGIRSILSEGCEMALVGGVNLILIPDVMVAFDKTGMLSEEKEVRAFDQNAKGYVRGEGVGAMLLKPLSKAVEDRDSIYAVIRGSAINHSGRSYSLTSPNLKGQTQVIVNAYQEAGISPETVNYIEAHGAATQAGDNIEVRAFKKAFAQLGHTDSLKKCKIGALKPNIGHLEAASGVASLFKVILGMRHQIKPGVKHFEKLNPLIKLKDSPFYITNAHEAWEYLTNERGERLPRRASVHSFGFSGVNAHIVLEEWDAPPNVSPNELRQDRQESYLVVLSAKTEKGLQEAAHNLSIYSENSISLPDLAYTLQIGREAMDVRLSLLVSSRQELRDKLAQWQDGNTSIPGVYFGNNTQGLNRNPPHVSPIKDSKEGLQTLAKHWVEGASIDWSNLYQPDTMQRLAGIPGYPFEKQYCWISAPSSFETDAESVIPEGKEGSLISRLKTVLYQVSGYQEVELQEDQTFMEMGFDSLLLTEFINRLECSFPLEFSFEVLVEQNTLEKLAVYLKHQLAQASSSDRSSRKNTLPLAPLLDSYPVSAEQLRYWRNHKFTEEDEGHQSLVIPICLEIKRNLDAAILKKALQMLIRHQGALRTVFHETTQGVRQQILDQFESILSTWEIAEGNEQTLKQTIEGFTRRKWNLTEGPLWRMGLIHQGEKTFLLLTLHHIIADLRSVQVFFNELSQLYSAWENKVANPLPLLSHQYIDYAYQEEGLHTSEEWQRRKRYWQNLLAAPWEELALPFKKKKKRQVKNKAGLITRDLDDSLQRKVHDFCKTHQHTSFTLYLSALKLLLYGLTEQKRLIVGTPLQHRDKLEWEPLIGCFAEVSFSLLELDESQTLLVLVEQVRDNILDIRKHALGFSETTSFLQKSRQDPLCPVVQVMFNTMKFPQALKHQFGADSSLIPLNRPFLDFDIALTLNEEESGCTLNIEYAQNLFEAKTIQQFGEQFEHVLSWLIRSPELPVEQIFEWTELVRRKPVRIAATFTADLLKASFQYWMEVLGESVTLSFAEFNQVFQELLDPSSLLRQNKRGVNVLLLRLSDWQQPTQNLLEIVTQWIETLQAAVQTAQTPYLVLICPTAPDQDEGLARMIVEAEQKIRATFQESRQVVVLDSKQIQQSYAVETVHNQELDQLASIPYSETYFNGLGTMIVRQCFGQWFPQYKVLVVDGDHTLWQGTVGEDGVDGINLDDGRRKFQQKLIALQKNGVLLCLCSKNVEEDILAIFEKRGDFPLKKEHFVAIKANWEPKSANLKTLGTELNLSLDRFLFIDDNPLEIAEVRAQFRQVLCLQFPQDVSRIETFVDHIWFFDRQRGTHEDQHRTQMVRHNLEREHLKASTPSYAEFLNSLALQITLSPMEPQQISRISQLTQRTNQFNSTTIRRSEQTIRELAEQEDIHIEKVAVRDRFGDYGLVGVMFIRFTSNKATIESLILSCRVLGRGVEHEMLARAGEIALNKGIQLVDIPYRPSARNTPILNFLKSIQRTYCEIEAEGLCLSLSSRQLAKVHFDPDQFASNENEPLSLQNPPFQQQIQTDHILEWVEQWMAYSKMDLLTQKIEEQQKKYAVSERKFMAPSTETEKKLASIWQEVLKIDAVGTETSFFELGGTSLELVQVFSKMRNTFAVPLTLHTFTENTNIRSIANVILNYRATGPFSQTDLEFFPNLVEETILPDDLKAQIGCLSGKMKCPRGEEKVLLTGSTGFLGAYLLNSLLEKTSFVVCCLVRAKDASSGLERIRKNMATYNFGMETGRVEAIPGDLSQKNLGLSEETYHRLSREISRVYHNGALVNFVLPYESLKPTNVDGTRECLRFASTHHLKPFHYVSTASVFDSKEFHSIDKVNEEKLKLESYRVYGGYAQSKWVAEMLVVNAGKQGLPTAIYRPNGIGPSMDPNHTGFNIDDVLSLILLASLSIGKFFDLPIHIDFAPVDYIASAIVALSHKSEVGQIYSMANPHPQTLAKVQKELRQLGEEVQLISYSTWVFAIEQYAETVENQKLLALLPLLQEPMPSCGETWFELSARRPQFDCANTIRDLQGAELTCPEINTDSIMKLLLLSFLTNNYLESTRAIKPYPPSDTHPSRLLERRQSDSFRKKVIILTWSLGSGHNTSAQAIAMSLKKEDNLDVEIVDLGDWISLVRNLESFWNHLSRNNIAQLEAYIEVMQVYQQHETIQFRKVSQSVVDQLVDHYQPDTVISVCPLGCQLLRYFKSIFPPVQAITYVSDWFGGPFKEWGDAGADWIYSPSQECTQFLIETCTDTQPNIADKLVTGSLIIRSEFSQSKTDASQSRLRKKWGIGEEEKVLLFNSYGNEKSIELLKNIPVTSTPLRVMVMCYNNKNILKKVKALKTNFPGKIEGQLWLDNINEWLWVSDVLFSKPGPGICAEALMTDTVIFLNALDGVMPQEVRVYEKLLSDKWGFGIETGADFTNALQDWLVSQTRYDELLSNVQNQPIQDGCEDFCQQVLKKLMMEEETI